LTGVTATLFFIFHLILLFFVIFIVSCSGATRLFLDVSCYFKMVTNHAALPPAGGVYDGESILSDRLRGIKETEWQNNFPAVGGDAGGG
jgi:hypothetical protein